MADTKTWTIRTGVGLVLVCGLAAGGYGIVHAASGSHDGALAGTDTASRSAAKPSGSSSPPSSWPNGGFRRGGAGFGPGAFGRVGAGFGPGSFGLGGASGTVATVATRSFTVKTQQGSTHTVDTTASTTYYEAVSKVGASALKAGERVAISFTRPASSAAGSSSAGTAKSVTPVAATVNIILPTLQGEVVSNSGGTIVIEDAQGFQRTVDTSGSTTYTEAGATVPTSAVTNGLDIIAFGTIASDHTDLDATTVEVIGPVAAGKVTKISGTTITVSSPWGGGGSTTIATTPSTIFRKGGKASSLARLKVGDIVTAIGTRESGGTFAATAVSFGSLASTPRNAGGLGLGGGFFGGVGSRPSFGGSGAPGPVPAAAGGGLDGASGFGSSSLLTY